MIEEVRKNRALNFGNEKYAFQRHMSIKTENMTNSIITDDRTNWILFETETGVKSINDREF